MVGTENLKRILDQICRDKGIDRSLLISAIEDAVSAAVRKKYGSRREIEVQFNDELGEVEVFQYRTVVDEVLDEETEISLEDARKLDPEFELDDDVGEKLDNIADLGRIAIERLIREADSAATGGKPRYHIVCSNTNAHAAAFLSAHDYAVEPSGLTGHN